MADKAPSPASYQPIVETKRARQRSPNYPAVSLRDAVERVRKLYDADKRAGAPLEAALRHFGFSGPHGSAMVVVSALKKYGLIEESNNRIVPTQRAVSILVYPESDERRQAALKDAALGPDIYREVFDMYRDHGKLASTETLSAELEATMKFNPSAVSGFVENFRDTLIYAGLTDEEGVILSYEGGEREKAHPQVPQVGQFVQWESQGVIQFEAKRIREISDDGKWAFVEGSNTGLLMAELTVVETLKLDIPPQPSPKSEGPPRPRTVIEQIQTTTQRQDVFSLAEGPVTIQWPAVLSAASYEDLADWLDILKRKIGRSVEPKKGNRAGLDKASLGHDPDEGQ